MSAPSPPAPMAKADLLTGVVLLALGLAMLYGGFAMDRLEIRQIHPASIPGLVPMGLGIALSVCAVILLTGAVRAGGLTAPFYAGDRAALLRLLACMALSLAYPLILIGWLPFWLATALFVSAFIALFEWTPRPPRAHAIAVATAILQGALVGIVTAYVFSELFLVRLP